MNKFQAIHEAFKEAIQRLDESLKQPKNEFMRDSAIKRFELVFDLSWKSMKAFLEDKGVTCASPLGCLKESYRQGLVAYDERLTGLVKIRNKTVHTYNEALAEEVYAALPDALQVFRIIADAIDKAKEEKP